ncbi:hypothetical protein DL89DRAFT_256584 [Linderina pennispora]|uniref:Uncharacterized protein n=1 Tax=Linderina pennispora TaxID=61395 RepID=A0A1Y1WEK1_9FUNG|nr:uncharacterized protein DL89DRAFT_256584 [Linderina pennispora]ORX71594.1 hypothetical protein DL89DRAFT_256584 [Linderina pennispora]
MGMTKQSDDTAFGCLQATVLEPRAERTWHSLYEALVEPVLAALKAGSDRGSLAVLNAAVAFKALSSPAAPALVPPLTLFIFIFSTAHPAQPPALSAARPLDRHPARRGRLQTLADNPSSSAARQAHKVPVPQVPRTPRTPRTPNSAKPGHSRAKSTQTRDVDETAKYGSHRMRAHRRRTDGSTIDSETSPIQRPRTAHGPASPEFSTYSQYPDFETVTNPFAKSDKIPRKRVPARPAVPQMQQQGQQDVDSTINASSTVASVPERLAVKLQDVGASKSLRVRKDSQENVPAPLRRHDLIPRHSEHPGLFAHMKPVQQPEVEPEKTNVLSATVMPGKPLVRTDSLQSSKSNGSRATAKSASTGGRQKPRRTSHSTGAVRDLGTSGQASLAHSQQPGRPFSGHDLGSRIRIDMDKVEGLYQRQSQIFEKEKAQRDGSSSVSAGAGKPSSRAGVREPLQPQHPPSPISDTSSPSTVHESQQAMGQDDIRDERIPFQDVLIPMVFKKLCKDLEDPGFEIDEEAYRKFKLSERWYAREERKLRKNLGEANSGASIVQTPPSVSPEPEKQLQNVPEAVSDEEGAEEQRPSFEAVAPAALPPRQKQQQQLFPGRRRTPSLQHSVAGDIQAVMPSAPPMAHHPAQGRGIPRGYESPNMPPRVSSATAAAHAYRSPPAGSTKLMHAGARQDPEQMSSRFNQLEVHDPQSYPQRTRSYYSHQQQQQTVREERASKTAGCCGCNIM